MAGGKIWENVRTLTSLDTRSAILLIKCYRVSYSLRQVDLRVLQRARLPGTAANELNPFTGDQPGITPLEGSLKKQEVVVVRNTHQEKNARDP